MAAPAGGALFCCLSVVKAPGFPVGTSRRRRLSCRWLDIFWNRGGERSVAQSLSTTIFKGKTDIAYRQQSEVHDLQQPSPQVSGYQ